MRVKHLQRIERLIEKMKIIIVYWIYLIIQIKKIKIMKKIKI